MPVGLARWGLHASGVQPVPHRRTKEPARSWPGADDNGARRRLDDRALGQRDVETVLGRTAGPMGILRIVRAAATEVRDRVAGPPYSAGLTAPALAA